MARQTLPAPFLWSNQEEKKECELLVEGDPKPRSCNKTAGRTGAFAGKLRP